MRDKISQNNDLSEISKWVSLSEDLDEGDISSRKRKEKKRKNLLHCREVQLAQEVK